jgi:CRP-like cAMP-binding protein
MILLLVLYSSVSVPVRIAFAVDSDSGFMLGLAFFFEIIFLFDIAVNFRTCYFDTSKCELESNIRMIRQHYLRGWFTMDLLSSIPIEILTAMTSSDKNGSKSLGILKILRLLKLFRLVRLMHLNAIKDLEYRGYLPPSLVRLFKLIFVFLLITHLVACAYWAQARVEISKWNDDTSGWLPLEKYAQASLFSQYADAFYWAMLVFVGADMNPTDTTQTAFTSFMMLIGIGVFASVIGSASSLLTNLDSVAEMKKSQMDSINHYLTFHSVPKNLRNKIRDYYDYLWLSGQSIHDKNLFDQLPESLNLQLDLSLKRKLIEGVPMFKEISPLSVLAIIRKLSHTIAIPEEVIMRQGEQGDCMYFLMRGQADAYLELPAGAKHLTTMSDGAVFGEIALVHPEKPRTATVCALSYCEMQELKLPDFDELKQVYDDIAFHVMVTADRRLDRSSKKAKEATRESFNTCDAKTKNLKGHTLGLGQSGGGDSSRPRVDSEGRASTLRGEKGRPPPLTVTGGKLSPGPDDSDDDRSPSPSSWSVPKGAESPSPEDGGGGRSGAHGRTLPLDMTGVSNLKQKGKSLRGKVMTSLKSGSKKDGATDIFNLMQQQSKKITRAQSRKNMLVGAEPTSPTMVGGTGGTAEISKGGQQPSNSGQQPSAQTANGAQANGQRPNGTAPRSAAAMKPGGSIRGSRVAPQPVPAGSASPAGDTDALVARRLSPPGSGNSGGDGHAAGATPPAQKGRRPVAPPAADLEADLEKGGVE